MYGAFIGDYCGSAYEYSNLKNYHFNLFPSNANFTDDTVLTLAIADALNKINTDKTILVVVLSAANYKAKLTKTGLTYKRIYNFP